MESGELRTQSSSNTLLELLKGGLFSYLPVPSGVVLVRVTSTGNYADCSTGMLILYVALTPSLSSYFTSHVIYVMLTLLFHGINHMFVVVISQQLVYIHSNSSGSGQRAGRCALRSP